MEHVITFKWGMGDVEIIVNPTFDKTDKKFVNLRTA
jgi:hypothetical protein